MKSKKSQSDKVITMKRKENTIDLSNLLGTADLIELKLYDRNKKICEHCRDTGVNLKFIKANKIINAISDYNYKKRRVDYNSESDVPYCKYCFGRQKIDQERKNISQHYNDIEIFLIYVANCETVYDCDNETAMHYDILDDSWKEYNGSYNVPEAKLNLVKYMREFRTDGYFDITVNSAKDYFYKKNVFKRWIGLETRENLDICWCCNRHYTELKRFQRPGDAEDSEFTGPYLLDFIRPFCQVDKKAVKAFEEAYKFNKNFDATQKWLIKKYGNERAEEIIFASEAQYHEVHRWECRDCAHNISDNEYFDKLNENELSLDLDKQYYEKFNENELSSDLDIEYFVRKNEYKPFRFEDIKF